MDPFHPVDIACVGKPHMTSFAISALSERPFATLFELEDGELAARNMRRLRADSMPGYPCRVSLQDASVGEELLLLPFKHLPDASPYRASGPIFVRRGARRAVLGAGEIPASVSSRLISVRAYDAAHWMLHAEVCAGDALAAHFERVFADPAVAYLHLHNAKPGCYSCRVDRVARS